MITSAVLRYGMLSPPGAKTSDAPSIESAADGPGARRDAIYTHWVQMAIRVCS
jgi:hypothetical protein